MDFDFVGELASVGQLHFDGKGFLLLVRFDGHVAVAKSGGELFLDAFDGLGFQIGQFDALAEFLKRIGASGGLEF